MTTSEQAMPRAEHVYPRGLLEWAANYRRKCLHPAKIERRFLIATYQPLQAENYPAGSPNFNEAMMASVLHYMMVYDECGLDPCFLERLEVTVYGKLDVADAFYQLRAVRNVCQQLVYRGATQRTGDYQRASRYDEGLMRRELFTLMQTSIKQVPHDAREEATYNAMDIMCGKL